VQPLVQSDLCWQNNAPAHNVCETVQLLTRETSDFIVPTPWPANSPDLSPVNYRISGKLQDRVYCSWIHDVAQPKSRQIEEWEDFNHEMIDWSSMKQSGSDVHVFKLAFEHVEEILNIDFKYVWVLYFTVTCLNVVSSGHTHVLYIYIYIYIYLYFTKSW